MGLLKFFRDWKELNKRIARSFNRVYERVVALEKEKITRQEIEELISKRIAELREQSPRTPRTKIRQKVEKLVNRVELVAEIRALLKRNLTTTEIFKEIVENRKLCKKTCFYKHLRGVREHVIQTPRTKIAS